MDAEAWSEFLADDIYGGFAREELWCDCVGFSR